MQGNKSIVAKRYARALFECLETPALAAQVLEQTELILRVLTPEIESFLSKESVGAEIKSSLVLDLSKAIKADSLLERSLVLLADRNRLGVLRAFLMDLRSRIDAKLGIKRVEYVVSEGMAPGDLAAVQNGLAEALGGTVRLSVVVDPNLLAGCILRIGNLVADLSLRTRIMQMRESLSVGA
jgi:F-type H+-transporting ATPase subunit delta